MKANKTAVRKAKGPELIGKRYVVMTTGEGIRVWDRETGEALEKRFRKQSRAQKECDGKNAEWRAKLATLKLGGNSAREAPL